MPARFPAEVISSDGRSRRVAPLALDRGCEADCEHLVVPL